jgi:hypothetical protein
MEMKGQLGHNMITATSSIINASDSIERRIENVTEGISYDCFRLLHNTLLPANKENAMIICDYITSIKSEINPSDGHRKNTIILQIQMCYQKISKRLGSC